MRRSTPGHAAICAALAILLGASPVLSAPRGPAPAKAAKPPATPSRSPAPADAPATSLTKEPPLDTSVPPPSLPRASRERMRSCAEEWSRKKLGSTTALPSWRDFATACLTRR